MKKSEIHAQEKPKVSVVIPSYNAERHIQRCLLSVLSQKTNIPYEVIIVDSSIDATPTIIKKEFPAARFPIVKMIRLRQQTYPGAARNIGVREAQGKTIAFIDADCAAAEDWIEQGVRALNEQEAKRVEGSYSLIGGSVVNANPGIISWADYLLTFNEFLPTMPKNEVHFMPTCNFFISKEIFQQMGGFREDLLAGEDTLFCYAASKKYKLLFEPQLQVKHTNRETWKNFIAHHHSFGKHSAQVRKRAELPGSALAKKPFLALLAPPARISRIGWRMCRYNYRYLPAFLASLPYIVSGTVAWSRGFIREARENKQIITGGRTATRVPP